jgi:Domain of unknown function (DUF7025)
MKSQRFGISNLPFRKSKNVAQEHDSKSEEGEKEEKKQTLEEQLASVVLDEEAGSDGEDCELHVYEERLDTRGETVVLRAGTKSEITPPKNKSHRACLVLTRHYDSERKLDYTELEIQSRHVIKALQKVIGTYEGVDLTSNPVTILEPPRCLFHYQDKLREYAEASVSQQVKSHLQLCLQYVEKTLHQEIKIFQSSVLKASSPEIDHRNLWMVFKPGCLVYEKKDGIERVSRLRSMHNVEEIYSHEIKTWHLLTERIHYIGSDIGLSHHGLKIDRYEGRKPVWELTAVPLDFHPEEERIRHDLLERGRKFISLCGIRHCFYDGASEMCYRFSPQDDETSHTNVCASVYDFTELPGLTTVWCR